MDDHALAEQGNSMIREHLMIFGVSPVTRLESRTTMRVTSHLWVAEDKWPVTKCNNWVVSEDDMVVTESTSVVTKGNRPVTEGTRARDRRQRRCTKVTLSGPCRPMDRGTIPAHSFDPSAHTFARTTPSYACLEPHARTWNRILKAQSPWSTQRRQGPKS